MSRRTLIELGWDARRVRILLRLPEWEYLERLAKSWGVTPSDVIPGMIDAGIRERRRDERVDITPAGEEAADELERLARAAVASPYDEAPQR